MLRGRGANRFTPRRSVISYSRSDVRGSKLNTAQTSEPISLRNFSCIKCFLCWTFSRSCFRICHFFNSSLNEMCSRHSKNRFQVCNVDRQNSYTATSTSFRVYTSSLFISVGVAPQTWHFRDDNVDVNALHTLPFITANLALSYAYLPSSFHQVLRRDKILDLSANIVDFCLRECSCFFLELNSNWPTKSGR